MIYVTGDTHGEAHRDKLEATNWPTGQSLNHDDYVIVCGDFSGAGSPEERYKKVFSWWENQCWTTLFIDGNHEIFDVLDSMDTKECFGAPVHINPSYPHVIHLMRGYVYSLPDGHGGTISTLAMGGAQSVDRASRTEGFDWWAREMPSEEEYDRCTANLAARNWNVDYVLTHELPADLRMYALDWRSYAKLSSGADVHSSYLQWIYDNLNKDALKCWYAGHYHIDKIVDDKVRVLFDDIVTIDATEIREQDD